VLISIYINDSEVIFWVASLIGLPCLQSVSGEVRFDCRNLKTLSNLNSFKRKITEWDLAKYIENNFEQVEDRYIRKSRATNIRR